MLIGLLAVASLCIGAGEAHAQSVFFVRLASRGQPLGRATLGAPGERGSRAGPGAFGEGGEAALHTAVQALACRAGGRLRDAGRDRPAAAAPGAVQFASVGLVESGVGGFGDSPPHVLRLVPTVQGQGCGGTGRPARFASASSTRRMRGGPHPLDSRAGRDLGRTRAAVGRTVHAGADETRHMDRRVRRTCHDLDRRLRLAFGERQQNDRRLQSCYEGIERTFSIIHTDCSSHAESRTAGSHARPFRDAEHDGATQPGDHAMRVTSWNCSRGADVSRRGRQGPIIRL